MAVSGGYVLGIILAAVSGFFLSVQSGVNSTLGAIVGRGFASVISFAVGLSALAVFFVIEVYGAKAAAPTWPAIRSVPWWGWTGGLMGAFYVAVVIIFAPTLGAATLMATFVTAQLCTAVALDSLGFVGFKRRELHWARILGLCLMITGVVLVTHFDGTQTRKSSETETNAEAGPEDAHRALTELTTSEVCGQTKTDMPSSDSVPQLLIDCKGDTADQSLCRAAEMPTP